VGRDALSEASCSSIPMSSRSSSLAPPCCRGSGGIATLNRVEVLAAARSAAARSAAARSAAACSAAAEAASVSAASRTAARSTIIAASGAARASVSRQLRLRLLSTAGRITRSQTAKLLCWRLRSQTTKLLQAYVVGVTAGVDLRDAVAGCLTRVPQATTPTIMASTMIEKGGRDDDWGRFISGRQQSYLILSTSKSQITSYLRPNTTHIYPSLPIALLQRAAGAPTCRIRPGVEARHTVIACNQRTGQASGAVLGGWR
jgi:hypothetical protein